jgi:ComF family protein
VHPVYALYRETLQLLLPRDCAGCGLPDVDLCAHCRHTLGQQARLVSLSIQRELFGSPVVAAFDYAGIGKDVVVSFKDRGRHDLTKALTRLVFAAWPALGKGGMKPLLLVPLPSHRGGHLKRGYEPTWLIASELSRFLPHTRPVRLLHAKGIVRGTQRKTLSKRQRLHTPPRFRCGAELHGYRIVLVDDVVTTGSSLEQATRTLRECGAEVVGALVLAAAVGTRGDAHNAREAG